MRKPILLTAEAASAFGQAELGGKAANLAWLSRNGFPVPDWLVLTTAAFDLQILQRMIDSEISGVAFTAHPISRRRDQYLISAAYGSGEGIVSGLCRTDEFTVPLYGDTADAVIGPKEIALVFDRDAGQGLKQAEIEPSHRSAPCLTGAQVLDLRDLVREIAERLGRPQDIERAVAGGRFHILQTRPITSLPALAKPKGGRVVWDNSNIQESSYGVTTP